MESDKKIENFKDKINSVLKNNNEKSKEAPKINIKVNINIIKNVVDNQKKGSKSDSSTQTEDIFFKFPWTFFRNKYKIITPSIKRFQLEQSRGVGDQRTINPQEMQSYLMNNSDVLNFSSKQNLLTVAKNANNNNTTTKKISNLIPKSFNQMFSNSLGNSLIIANSAGQNKGNLSSNINYSGYVSGNKILTNQIDLQQQQIFSQFKVTNSNAGLNNNLIIEKNQLPFSQIQLSQPKYVFIDKHFFILIFYFRKHKIYKENNSSKN